MKLVYPEEGGTWLGTDVIETCTGKPYDFMHPDLRNIGIVDIAYPLSTTNRFGGHAKPFVSVAQHSVLVCDIVRAESDGNLELLQAALLHDAHEAFLGDVPRPMKPRLGDGYKDLARRADEAIAERFEISVESMHDPRIKEADITAMTNEGHLVMVNGPPEEEITPLPCGLFASPVDMEEAFQMYLDTANELGLY